MQLEILTHFEFQNYPKVHFALIAIFHNLSRISITHHHTHTTINEHLKMQQNPRGGSVDS